MTPVRWRVVVLLLLLLPLAFLSRAQECNLSLYKDSLLSVPYDVRLNEHFVQADQVCALVDINIAKAPFPCYNITVMKATLCTATLQPLLPRSSANQSAAAATTGCNTPVTVGSLITNVLYNASNPHAIFSAYNPRFTFISTTQHNRIVFCYNSHAFSPFNNILEVDWRCADSLSSGEYRSTTGNGTCYGEYFVECPKGKSLVIDTPSPGVGGAACAKISRPKEDIAEILLAALVLLLLACVLIAMVVVVFWAPRRRGGYYQVAKAVPNDADEELNISRIQ